MVVTIPPFSCSASAGSYGTVRVWDVEIGTELLTLSGHTGNVNQVVWNADGSRILTASWDGTEGGWDAETGGELLTPYGQKE